MNWLKRAALRTATSSLFDHYSIGRICRMGLTLCVVLLFIAPRPSQAQVLPVQVSTAPIAGSGGNGTGRVVRVYPLSPQNLPSKSIFGTLQGGSTPSFASRLGGSTAFGTSLGVSTSGLGTVPSGATGTSGVGNLQYYGGPVISNLEVVVVYWGNNVSSVVTTGIPGFISAMTTSSYMDMLSEYSTNGMSPIPSGAPGNQSIGHGSLSAVYTIVPSVANSGTTVDDAQIQAELLAQINAGHLQAPATDSNGLVTTEYMIYFPPGVSITLTGISSCVQFCAYHGTVVHNLLDVPYGVMPDLGPGTGCSAGCAAGTEFDDLTTVTSHELAESITDAAVGLATTYGPPLAWYDVANGEIGDICNASGAPSMQVLLPGTSYTVQKEWSNLQRDCVSAPPTFTLSAPTSSVLSGPMTLGLTVQGSTGATLTPPYTGTVQFTSSDGAAILPGNYTFTAADGNAHTFSDFAILKSPGPQTITVTDMRSGGFVGVANVTVRASDSAFFLLGVPSTATSGAPFTFTVSALDRSGNPNVSYGGTVHFTSSDSQAKLPGDATLINGTGTFNATLGTIGKQTITATDTVTSTIIGTSFNIADSGMATHFALSAPASTNSGSAFNFTVTAQDQTSSTAMGYSGTVHFTSSDGQAVLPGNATLTNGTGMFSATLKAGGFQTITATDAVTSTISGTSSSIANGGMATHFALSAPASATTGIAFGFTIIAQDQFNNTTPGYSGTVHFTSSDGQAVLPADATLTNGGGTFSATLKTWGIQTISATDTLISTFTGTSGNISVASNTPAATPNLSPIPWTYNTPQSVKLTDSTPNVTFYYTTDGSTPTTSSTLYTGPIPISTTTTINAIAAGGGYIPSAVISGTYAITAVTPTLSPVPWTYNAPQSVKLTDSTPGVSIYFTTDGSLPTTGSRLYTGPIPVSTTTTINAIAAGGGYGPSTVTGGIYAINAVTPTLSPVPWTYNTPQSVKLTDSTPGVSIYFTTDGSLPTTGSRLYTGPIPVSTTTTINALAAGGGYGPSTVTGGIYAINAVTPTLSPVPWAYSTPQSVKLTDSTPGVSIYFTTDGSIPTTGSRLYTVPILVSATTTINALATGGGYGPSTVTSGTYTITAAPATFSPYPWTYNTPQSVKLADNTPGVTIYYTTNGSTPTTSSTPYTGPIPISTTTTINALAAGGGYGPSTVTSGTYTITAATATFSPYPWTYNTPQSVKLTDSTPGVTIYYTTNGSTPTTSSTPYTGPIPVSATTTINAIAAGGGYGSSTVTSGTYTITVR